MPKRVILCVDDEYIVLLALKLALRSALGDEYRIETALSGSEALMLLSELEAEGAEPAAVISDWLMPGMRGDEFLRKVRLSKSGLCLILLTGYGEQEEIRTLAADVGLAAVLDKPCTVERIVGILRERCSA